MAKVKALLPSLREKKRYVVFEVLSRNKIRSFSSIANAVWQGMLGFNGQLGAAQAGLRVFPNKYNPATQRGIARVSHTSVDKFTASLTLIKDIENQPVIVRAVRASGMLNKAEQLIAG